MTGAQLKVWRLQQGWTQQELASRLKVRVMTLSFWETGRLFPKGLPEARVQQIQQVAKRAKRPIPRGK